MTNLELLDPESPLFQQLLQNTSSKPAIDWHSFDPVLHSKGYVLAEPDTYNVIDPRRSDNATTMSPPINSFIPSTSEYFVHHPSPTPRNPNPLNTIKGWQRVVRHSDYVFFFH